MSHKLNTEGAKQSFGEVNLHKQEEFSQLINSYRLIVSELHRRAVNHKIPVIIIFEGVNGAGKGSLVNELIINLDPRFIKFYATHKPTREEKLKPFLWAYWSNIPKRGQTAIFYRSWYSKLIYNHLKKKLKKEDYKFILEEINNFEKTLSDEGYIIIKFFLHISGDTQKEIIKKMKNNPLMSWKAEEYEEADYHKYNKIIGKFMELTNNNYAPWYFISSENKQQATIEMYKILETALNTAINKTNNNKEAPFAVPASTFSLKGEELNIKSNTTNEKKESEDNKTCIKLSEIDLTKTLSKKEYKERIKPLQQRLRELQYKLYENRVSLIILYEGWDAAGKGGNIKRLIKELEPTGYQVIPIGKPTTEEQDYHYLWRFWTKIPKQGHVAIFDRSWYGRVLVEKVEGYINGEQCERSFKEINEMEKSLTFSNTLVIKVFIHIDKEEQLKRFKKREDNPHKNWKITEEDYRNREKWEKYVLAIEQMICNTSTELSPWNLIEGNCKRYGRIKVLETVINTIENKFKDFKKF